MSGGGEHGGLDAPGPAPLTSSQRGEGWDTLEEFQSLPSITSSLDYALPEHSWPPKDAWMPMRRTSGAALKELEATRDLNSEPQQPSDAGVFVE